MITWIKTLGLAVVLAMGLNAAQPGKAVAQDHYIGQIFLGGWNFCPRNSVPADGRLLPISQYTAVFSLLGTSFGGDGRTTFGLPDLRGRTPLALGRGPGLSAFKLGQKGGAESTILSEAQMASHSHALSGAVVSQVLGSSSSATTGSPTGAAPAIAGTNSYASGPPAPMAAGTAALDLSTTSLSSTGQEQVLDLRDPYLALQYCIALEGVFPERD